MRTALVIIDLQKEFFSGLTQPSPELDEVLDHINHVASLHRERELPVFMVQDHDSVGPGEVGFELINGLDTAPTDQRIVKRDSSAFRGTDFADQLAAAEVQLVVFAGFSAEGCVLSTLKGAEERGIPYAILRNGITSLRPDSARFIESISPIVSYEVIEAWMGVHHSQD